jgi:hypothetical protein
MRLALVATCTALFSLAQAAPRRVDMGTWDCQGSKPREVVVTPGAHVYVWRGACVGAEGFDVVVDPASPALTPKTFYDAKTKELRLELTNKRGERVRVKLHVFVGFA